MWKTVKAGLLEIGSAKVIGESADDFIAKSSSGPGLGGNGSIFFEKDSRRIRLNISEKSPVALIHHGNGSADIIFKGEKIEGHLEKPGQHCPKQAFITISGSCIYRCGYCSVHKIQAMRKSVDKIIGLVKNAGEIEAISLTSGVAFSPKEEEENTVSVVKALKEFRVPIGVEIYPLEGTSKRLFDAGVSEVKFNLETSTPKLFEKFCPAMDRDLIEKELIESVKLFGKNHVFTNIIIGLGEIDEDVEKILNRLGSFGIIASLRPLTPANEVSEFSRPSADRILKLFEIQKDVMKKYGLDPKKAETMCVKCTGCDLMPLSD